MVQRRTGASTTMPKITIYTSMMCPYCHLAKELLRSKGVSYDEIDVTGRRELRAEMTRLAGGRTSVPQIFIGDHHVGGYTDLVALDRAGGLAPLLGQTAGS